MFWLSLLIVIGFVLIHIFTNYIKFLSKEPKNRLMSLVSGGSVAYIFLHLVPELSHYHEVAEKADLPRWMESLDYVTYLFTLSGLILFYGINQLGEKSIQQNKQNKNMTRPSNHVFILEISAFAMYNILIGYLFVELSGEHAIDYILYFIVFSFHFIANNRILHLTHEDLYTKVGRWILAASVFSGWFIFQLTPTSDLVIAFFSAFLTGGIVLNIMNDELPEEKNSSFPAFLVGLVFITVLLQLIL